MTKTSISVITFAVLLGASSASLATSVRPMALADIAKEATRIVHGTVSEQQSGRDEHGLPATWTTVIVGECLKGNVTERVTIKQYGVQKPLADGTLMPVQGGPALEVGSEVVLFLRADSALGFTSPVGFSQGVYRVQGKGARSVVQSADMRSPIHPLDGFLKQVRQFVAGDTTYRK